MSGAQKFLFVGGPFAGIIEEHEHAVIEKFSKELDHGEPFLMKHIYVAKSLRKPGSEQVARVMLLGAYEKDWENPERITPETLKSIYEEAVSKGAWCYVSQR